MTNSQYGPVGGFGTDMDPNRGAFDNLKPVVKSGLDKIRAIGEYIRNNNVGTELKDRFTNVLQGYKTKLANSARAGMGSSDAKNLVSSPVHKTAMSAIMKYKGRPAGETLDNRITNRMVDKGKLPEYYRENMPQGKQEPKRMDETRMMNQRNQEDWATQQNAAWEKERNAMTPAQFNAARRKASADEMDIIKKRGEAGEFDEGYKRKALNQF